MHYRKMEKMEKVAGLSLSQAKPTTKSVLSLPHTPFHTLNLFFLSQIQLYPPHHDSFCSTFSTYYTLYLVSFTGSGAWNS